MRFKIDDQVKYFDEDEGLFFHGVVTDVDIDKDYCEVFENESKTYMCVFTDLMELDTRGANLDLI